MDFEYSPWRPAAIEAEAELGKAEHQQMVMLGDAPDDESLSLPAGQARVSAYHVGKTAW